MTFSIVFFIVFILLSAFFSASETAIFSLGNIRLRRLQERYPKAKIVKRLLKKPTHLLSAIVFGNILVNIGFSSLATVIFVTTLGEEALALAIVLSGVVILLFGEIFPKTVAIYSAERLSLFSSPILYVFSRIFHPLIQLIEKIVNFFSSFVLLRGKETKLSEEELKTALLLSRKEGYITEEEEEMISYVLEFKDTHISEIMTPRVDVKGIDFDDGQEEALRILKQTRHSKLPVYKESLDNVVGILHAKDVILNLDKDYHDLLKEPILVPDSNKIDALLKVFLEKDRRIAVVLDEYGGTAGLVTLEDIEEEIFGEIYDEFEAPQEMIERIDEKTWRIYGKTPIKNVNLEFDLDFPEEEDTIAGFLIFKMQKIPRAAETIKVGNLKFTIERATAKRILSVILELR